MSRFLGRRPASESEPEYSEPVVTDGSSGLGSDSSDPGCLHLIQGCFRYLSMLVIVAGIILFLGLAGFIGGYVYLNNELSGAIDQVVQYQGQGPGGTPRFYDRNGQLLFELKTVEKRRWLDYVEIPLSVTEATVAVEDDTFWSNRGIDPEAVIAALINNYQNQGERPVGASTITQQLVKHIAFSYEERVTTSYDRKVREMFLAFILTQRRSKQDILTMYLNEIYY